MKYRPHRETLSEAMKECVDLEDGEALIRHIRETRSMAKGQIELHHYGPNEDGPNLDDRIGWKDTWIVTIGGAAVGFTDGPPPGHLSRDPWRYVPSDLKKG